MSPRSSRLAIICLGALAVPLAGCGSLRPDRALAVAPNLVSHQLCSAVFVAGLDPTSYYREALAPDLAGFNGLMRYNVDRAHGQVTASLGGAFPSRAVYRGAEGCLVVQGPVVPR
jgi:hypothetical protein